MRLPDLTHASLTALVVGVDVRVLPGLGHRGDDGGADSAAILGMVCNNVPRAG